MIDSETELSNNYGPQRLTIELVNICNLHCNYCFRSEEALYSSKAVFFPVDQLKKILSDAKEVAGVSCVIFTGGEPTLHPQFGDVLSTVADAGLTSSFVTNGWHFERVWPNIRAHRDSLTHVAFSLDGITRETHDHFRGEGSFDRLIRAFSRCYMSGLPFSAKIAIRRDNAEQLEQIALFAARMGASALSFVHVMPTSRESDGSSLTLEERKVTEEEVALLARIFKMKIAIDVGYYNVDERPPCSPLAATSLNVDYRGRLTLCCNLSGYRNAVTEHDVVADLRVEPFAEAHAKLQMLSQSQNAKRKSALKELRDRNEKADLFTGSPCLFCLHTLGKLPWHKLSMSSSSNRALPVYSSDGD